MMARECGGLLSFSPGGERLAQGDVDGVLRIWDVSSGRLEQEYQPRAHLFATSTCIKFSPTELNKTVDSIPRKKKKADDDDTNRYSLVAVGTKSGSVFLYSPETKEIVTQLSHAPPHAIRDVAWVSQTKLFSLAANGTLVLWNVTTGKKVYTCEVSSGNSICAIDNKNVCLGSSKIQHIRVLKKGDTGTAKEERSFTGHTSKTNQLLPIPNTDASCYYFLSSAEDDRFIYAWNLKGKTGDPCASFMVRDAVSNMTVASGKQSNPITVAVTTRKGALVLFTEHLNGNLQKKAVKYKGKLTICRQSGDEKQPIPILCSYFLNDVEDSIMIAFGNAPFLNFERINVQQLSGEQELIRNLQPTSRGKGETQNKTVIPEVTEDSIIMGPSTAVLPEGGHTKRKRNDPDGVRLLPMEEMLNDLAIDKVAPKSDDMVHLLLQGLQSQDHKLLDPVLSCKNNEVVNNTVCRLPVQAIAPLLNYLQQAIEEKGKEYLYASWIKSILHYHMSFLSTLPDRKALVLPFYNLATGRVDSLVQMMQLKSRLDLVLSHITTRHKAARNHPKDYEALLAYQDESSSDDDFLEAPLGASESGDNWDELSEFADVNGHSEDSDMEVDPATSSSKRKNSGSIDGEPNATGSDSESISKNDNQSSDESEDEEEEEEEEEVSNEESSSEEEEES